MTTPSAVSATPQMSSLPRALVGRDQLGRWVVRDEGGLFGGLFRDRAEALRFAHDEGLAHRPRRAPACVERLAL